jgi:hypothetical protein
MSESQQFWRKFFFSAQVLNPFFLEFEDHADAYSVDEVF